MGVRENVIHTNSVWCRRVFVSSVYFLLVTVFVVSHLVCDERGMRVVTYIAYVMYIHICK